MQFINKYYLIIGGSSGIGLAVADKITKQGGNVILVASQYQKLEKALVSLSDGKNYSFCYDLNDVNNIEQIFLFCKEKEIILSGLVYCAGIAPLCLLRDNTPELMQKVYNINFFSFIESVKNFQNEKFSLEKSKIVVVSSITAQGAGYRQTIYGSSKAAIISAVKLMSKELLNRKIYINALSPGVTDTEMLQALMAESAGMEEKIKKTQILGSIPAKDVANAIIFLLSDEANYITGTEMIVDGGALLK